MKSIQLLAIVAVLALGGSRVAAQHPCDDCSGDLNGDGRISGADIQAFTRCYRAGPALTAGCGCADVNLSGAVDLADTAPFVTKLIANPKPAACCEVTITGGSFLCDGQMLILTATGAPAGGTCISWTTGFTGAGRVTIAPTGCSATLTATVVSSAIDDVTITVSYMSPSGALCTAQKKVTVTKLVPTNIRFDYKPMNTSTGDGLNIRQNAKLELGEVSGTADATLPVGNGKGDGEWNPSKSRNLPALYVANKAVKCAARFTIQPAGILSAKIKATKTGTLFAGVAETTVAFNAGTGISNPEYTEMAFDANTPNRIRKDRGDLQWSATEVNGVAMAGCNFATTGSHTFYTVLDYPRSPWYDNDNQHPWVDALEFAIMGTSGTTFALDKTTVAAAASAITTGIFQGYRLDYDTRSGAGRYCTVYLPKDATGCTVPGFAGKRLIRPTFNLTKFFSDKGGTIICCYDCAAAVTSFTAIIGGDPLFLYMEPFGFIYKTPLILNPGPATDCNNPFYRSPTITGARCVGGGCISNVCRATRSSFGNHAFVRLTSNSMIYDACVGPHLGTETLAQYITNSIDVTPASIPPAPMTCEELDAGTAANVCQNGVLALE